MPQGLILYFQTWPEDNDIARVGVMGVKHAKDMKLIALFLLSFVAERSSQKGFEFVMNEVAKC